MITVEMHCHTIYSPDGFITKRQLVERCRLRGIDVVCITDHNTMAGLAEFADISSVRVVAGQEIRTQAGEIIGLFLGEQIQPGLGLEETAERIKEQAGLVYLPHPFDEFRASAVKPDDAERIKDKIDIVEVFNSRTLNLRYNALAAEFAQRNGIVTAVGSDAHHRFELGNCLMRMDGFDTPESFLESLRTADCTTKRCPLALRLYIKGLKILSGKK